MSEERQVIADMSWMDPRWCAGYTAVDKRGGPTWKIKACEYGGSVFAEPQPGHGDSSVLLADSWEELIGDYDVTSTSGKRVPSPPT